MDWHSNVDKWNLGPPSGLHKHSMRIHPHFFLGTQLALLSLGEVAGSLPRRTSLDHRQQWPFLNLCTLLPRLIHYWAIPEFLIALSPSQQRPRTQHSAYVRWQPPVRDRAPNPFYRMLGQTHVNGWSCVIASQNEGSTSYIFPFRLRVLQWSRHLFNYYNK